MSTISLMPINKKFKLTKSYKFNVGHNYLGDSHKTLQEAGMVVGAELIMDEGSKMRIEGFSSSISQKDWPKTKITIYPEGKKQCQCYIQMSDLDGITWETIEGEAPKEKKEIQRINISLDSYHVKDNQWKKYPCRHASFKDNIARSFEGLKALNPLELNEAEITLGKFSSLNKSEIGEVVVRKGNNNSCYKMQARTAFRFEITKQPGLMYGKLVSVKDSLWLGPGYYPKDEEYVKLCDIDSDETKYEAIVTKYLKEKHNFE